MPTNGPLSKMIKDIEVNLSLVKNEINALLESNEKLEKENKQLKDKFG